MSINDREIKEFYDKVHKKVMDYIDFVNKTKFAEIELENFPHEPQTITELGDYIASIIETAKNLNRILEQSPSSIYVTDADGKTLRVNKSYEELSLNSRDMLVGKSTVECEKEGIFSPSVIRLALKEKRRVVIRQTNRTNRKFVVTGVPVYDEDGKVVNAVTNGLLADELQQIGQYLEKVNNKHNYDRDINMIVKSPQMKDIVELVEMIKDTSSTIMIEGETGTGKNVLARYIHNTSKRKHKKMLEMNCGAIPGALLESELFGYAAGAFTGANNKGKQGLIDICNGGTLVLDEVSELPINLQVKLLSVLQNKKFMRVGGVDEVEIDVRIIAISNRNLRDLVKEGKFREDLFYRLNVVPIVIPPLRERKEEISSLIKHFVDKYSRLHAKSVTLSDKRLEEIYQRDWRGNIRELENYIERLVVTSGNDDIINEIIKSDDTYLTISEKDDSKDNEDEKTKMLRLYNKYGSSYKVAKEMKISQSTAYRKIKKYLNE